MKKFLNLILNGAGAVLAIVALFLGFAPVAASITSSGVGPTTTVTVDDYNSLFGMFTDDNGSKYVGVGVVIIIFLVIAILAIGLLIAAEFLKKSCKWEWIINVGVCVLMVIAGILYFAIPEITKATLGSSTATAKINLAGGPIVAGIFSLLGGLAVGFNGVKHFIFKK